MSLITQALLRVKKAITNSAPNAVRETERRQRRTGHFRSKAIVQFVNIHTKHCENGVTCISDDIRGHGFAVFGFKRKSEHADVEDVKADHGECHPVVCFARTHRLKNQKVQSMRRQSFEM